MMFGDLNSNEQVPWMMKLRFGIDYVCKCVQFICPWKIMDEIKIYKMRKTYNNKNLNSENMNNKYCDV